MPIPPFNAEGVLPPHAGNPARSSADLSPYPVTIEEVCERWKFNPERRAILNGLIQLRAALRALGVVQGFQWLDGSFVEDCERNRHRPPGDIDVMTFFVPVPAPLPAGMAALPIIQNRRATKTHFLVDHIMIPLHLPPVRLVEQVRYWGTLFAHRKKDDLWKGMLKIELDDAAGDTAAQVILANATGATP